jgi:hypothetical protein
MAVRMWNRNGAYKIKSECKSLILRKTFFTFQILVLLTKLYVLCLRTLITFWSISRVCIYSHPHHPCVAREIHRTSAENPEEKGFV